VSWLRYSDDWTRDRAWDGVSYEARWHFMALMEMCSQSRRWDGCIPLTHARRASDVPDPDQCLVELQAGGFICVTESVTGNADATLGHAPDCVTDHAPGVAVPTVEDHIPTEANRDENRLPRKRANTAAWRTRKCAGGDHSKDCPPDTCELKLAKKAVRAAKAGNGSVSESVTTHAGTGRDGTGPTTLTSSKSESRSNLSTDVEGKFSSLDEKPLGQEPWPAMEQPAPGLPPRFPGIDRVRAESEAVRDG
jgi:hypothetical protein